MIRNPSSVSDFRTKINETATAPFGLTVVTTVAPKVAVYCPPEQAATLSYVPSLPSSGPGRGHDHLPLLLPAIPPSRVSCRQVHPIGTKDRSIPSPPGESLTSQVGPQPTLRFRRIHTGNSGHTLQLVASNPPHREVPGLRVGKPESADRGGRPHGARLG